MRQFFGHLGLLIFLFSSYPYLVLNLLLQSFNLFLHKFPISHNLTAHVIYLILIIIVLLYVNQELKITHVNLIGSLINQLIIISYHVQFLLQINCVFGSLRVLKCLPHNSNYQVQHYKFEDENTDHEHKPLPTCPIRIGGECPQSHVESNVKFLEHFWCLMSIYVICLDLHQSVNVNKTYRYQDESLNIVADLTYGFNQMSQFGDQSKFNNYSWI